VIASCTNLFDELLLRSIGIGIDLVNWIDGKVRLHLKKNKGKESKLDDTHISLA